MEETGLYYLQSRYYDPAIGRFINADTFTTTDADGFLSCNMFAYCENDPVNKNDHNGELSALAIHAIIGGISGGIVAAGAYAATHANDLNTYDFCVAVGIGIVNGVVSGVVNEFKSFAVIGSGVITGAYAAIHYNGSIVEKAAVFLSAGTIAAFSTWAGGATPSSISPNGSSGIQALTDILGGIAVNKVIGANSEIASGVAQSMVRKGYGFAKKMISRNAPKGSWLYRQAIISAGRARRQTA